jgi:hypothetical protein
VDVLTSGLIIKKKNKAKLHDKKKDNKKYKNIKFFT